MTTTLEKAVQAIQANPLVKKSIVKIQSEDYNEGNYRATSIQFDSIDINTIEAIHDAIATTRILYTLKGKQSGHVVMELFIDKKHNGEA